VDLPGIGRGIGSAIMEMVTTGCWSQLERLQGALQPEQLFQTLPGIGPELAARIHEALHVDTLEALELAAHDGSLATAEGIARTLFGRAPSAHPAPRTVLIKSRLGLPLMAFLRGPTVTSTVRTQTGTLPPHAAAKSSCRDRARPAFSMRTSSSWNSIGPRRTSRAARLTLHVARSRIVLSPANWTIQCEKIGV
jgi:hypothetical protein